MATRTPLPDSAARSSLEESRTGTMRSSRAEDRRRRLQNLRQQDRGSQSGRDSDTESQATSARPPRRQMSSRLRRDGGDRDGAIAALNESVAGEEDGVDDEDDTADGKVKKQEPQEVDEDYENLVTMSEPQHVFPTGAWIAPHTRGVENGLQPLLHTHPGHPKVTVPIVNCSRPMTDCCSATNPLIKFHKHELDVITGAADVVDYGNHPGGGGLGLFDQPPPQDAEEREGLLGNAADRDRAEMGLSKSGAVEPLMTTFHQRQDGLYANTLPVMAAALMRAEIIDTRLPIATLVQNDVCLSRATQRILRDVRGGLDQDRYRAMWRSMIVGSNYNNRSKYYGSPSRKGAKGRGPRRQGQGRGRDDGDDDDSDADADAPTTPLRAEPEKAATKPPRSTVHAAAELLKQLSVGPILRLPDDQVVDLPAQPVVPDATLAYGGALGQWPDFASAAERLGPLFAGGESKKGDMRAVLRVHIHQLGLLEHPWVSDEETQFARLKEVYQQYATLLQQDNLGYLCGRLVGIVDELRRLLSMYNEPITLDVEEKQAIRALYRDLVESLPALCEMRWAIDALAVRLLDGWKSIKGLRTQHQYTSTGATLTVRKLVADDAVVPDDVWDGDDDDDDDPADDDDDDDNRRGHAARGKSRRNRRRADSASSDEQQDTGRRRGGRARRAAAPRDPSAASEFGGGQAWMRLREVLPFVKDKLLDQVRDFVNTERAHEAAANFDVGVVGGGAGGGGARDTMDTPVRRSVSSTPKTGRSPRGGDRASVLRSSFKQRPSNALLSSTTGGLFGGEAALLPGMTAEEATDEYLDRTVELATVCVRDLLRGGGGGGRGDRAADDDDDDAPAASASLLPEYVIRLSEDGLVTPDSQVPPAEAERRRHVHELKYKAVLVVNGKAVTQSEVAQVAHPSLIANFNQFFELRLLNEPSEVSFEIYALRPGGWGCNQLLCCPGCGKDAQTLVSKVSLPLPGQGRSKDTQGGKGGKVQTPTHTFAPQTGWYRFSSEKPVVLAADKGRPQDRMTGAVLCTVEYDTAVPDHKMHLAQGRRAAQGGDASGLSGEDMALLPMPPLGADLAGPLGDPRRADFTRERDFQALLPETWTLDKNDPRNEYLFFLKSRGPAAATAGEQRDFFRLAGLDFAVPFGEDGAYYSNYLRFTKALRMRLLSLRDLKPHLFTGPIPLSEDEIRASELYKSLLKSEDGPGAGAGALGGLGGLGATLPSEMGSLLQAIGEDADDPVFDGDDLDEKSSANKTKISAFLQKVRNSHTSLSRLNRVRRAKMTTASAVAETEYYHLDDPAPIMLLPPPRRALQPKVKARTPMAIQVSRCDVLVQVVGARNVPLRVEMSDERVGAAVAAIGRGGSPNRASIARGQPADNAPAAGGGPGGPQIADGMLDVNKIREKLRARTFVEVSFQEHTTQTTCVEGGAPLWRQSLSLPFKAPQDDYTPANLAQVDDVVTFMLFDEIVADDSKTGGILEGENPERIERRFLGSFSIPFATVYREGRIEGTFRLDSPAFNFGYGHSQLVLGPNGRRRGQTMFVDAEDEDGALQAQPGFAMQLYNTITSTLFSAEYLQRRQAEQRQRQQEEADDHFFLIHKDTQAELEYFASSGASTYLKLMITLDPLLATPPTLPEEVSQGTLMPEDRFIAPYARVWLKNVTAVNANTKHRRFKLFGMNSSGYNSFIPRYLTAQRPPMAETRRGRGWDSDAATDDERNYDTMRACIHLVSTVPFMPDAQSFIGDLDLWCTAKQFLDIGAGDEEEHAVLLYNYLYYLSMRERGLITEDDDGAAGGKGKDGDDGKEGEGKNDHANPRRSSAFSSLFSRKQSGPSGYPSDDMIKQETVFLALGTAVPEGDTVYVIIRDKRKKADKKHALTPPGATSVSTPGYGPESFLVINPWSGYVYSAADPHCPLREIACLATPYNLWANVQLEGRPCMMQYDVLNVDHWRPFFGARLPPPSGGLRTVQTPIEYTDTTRAYAVNVELGVTNALKKQVPRWRARRANPETIFHTMAGKEMQGILEVLEDWKRTGRVPGGAGADVATAGRARASTVGGGPAPRASTDGGFVAPTNPGQAMEILQQFALDRMDSILSTRTLHGAPINVPFTDVDDIVAQVKKLCVHEAKQKGVQFVLAVKAFPMVNGIVSLWVFFGTLESKVR